MTTENKTQALVKYEALPIPLNLETRLIVPVTLQEQVALLTTTTPKQFIMQRKGRGGKELDYIETNYVIARLNATFFFNWDAEAVWQEVNWKERQVAVKVRLRVRFMDGREVTKEAFGGSDIKYNKVGEIIDFADDLKAAMSDAIKKAASMLGVGWDVYAGFGEESRHAPDPPKEKVAESPANLLRDKLRLARQKIGKETFDPLLELASGQKRIKDIPDDKLEKAYAEIRKSWNSRKKAAKKAEDIKGEKKDEREKEKV